MKPDEVFLFHTAATSACSPVWAKALSAHLIGTVGSAEKAALAKTAGA